MREIEKAVKCIIIEDEEPMTPTAIRQCVVVTKKKYTATAGCYDCTVEHYCGMMGEVCLCTVTGEDVYINVKEKTFHKNCPMVGIKGEE